MHVREFKDNHHSYDFKDNLNILYNLNLLDLHLLAVLWELRISSGWDHAWQMLQARSILNPLGARSVGTFAGKTKVCVYTYIELG